MREIAPPPFFVLSLPRSRSKWLSELLSSSGKLCGHDLLVECSSTREFELEMENWDGSCETGAMLGWRLLRQRWPEAKLVTIHRPVAEIMTSFARYGIRVELEQMMLREQMLLACSQSEGVLSFTYNQLGSFEVCSAIYEHCLGVELDYDVWLEFAARNIQIDLRARRDQLLANAAKLEALRTEIELRSPTLGDHSWARLN